MTHYHQKSFFNKWLLLILASIAIFMLYIKGGRFGYIGEFFLSIPGTNIKVPSGVFILLFILTWGVCYSIFFLFPPGLSFKKGSTIILMLSLLCRIALIPHEPSDDINRYLWEGKLVQNKLSPYQNSPESMRSSDLAKNDPYYEKINHPDISAAYPPLTLYLFSMLSFIHYAPISIKLAMIIFDMGAILCLLILLYHREFDFRWAVFYALNPLILYSFAGQGHFDVMLIFFLMGAFICYDKKWWAGTFLLLGFSVQVKYITIICLPFFIQRENVKYLCFFLLAVILPYVPFLLIDGKSLFHGLSVFGKEYSFNSSLHEIIRALVSDIELATMISGSIFVIFYVLILHRFRSNKGDTSFRDPVRNVFMSMGILLLCAPTIHFWYISWIIPLAVLRQSLSWIILTLSMCFYFIANGISHHTGKWDLPAVYQFMEWMPFYLVLFLEIYYFLRRKPHASKMKSPSSVSVIIPVKNEASGIGQCIDLIRRDPAVKEIIVVDALSTDETCRIAAQKGAIIVNNHLTTGEGGGRGGQIFSGIQHATSDIIAICHADTSISSPVFSKMVSVLSANPDISGGAVGGFFDQGGYKMKWIEIANVFRAVFLGISFGDQVQFFRRKLVVKTHIFPNIPLMEDVEFSIRLNGIGRQIFLFGDVLVSSRRWQKKGFKNSVWVIKTVVIYIIARFFKTPDTLALYKDYYGLDE